MSFENLDDFLHAQSEIGYADHLAKMEKLPMTTDTTNNFNDNPIACLDYYQARNGSSLMGYRPALDNELTRHFIAFGSLEWKAIDGVRYVKLTPQGYYHLEQYRHAETRAKLEATQKAIREALYHFQAEEGQNGFSIGVDGFIRFVEHGSSAAVALQILIKASK